MTVVMTRARYAERGTVRAGFFTSPLGINATSIPTNAKINRITASPNDLLLGQPLQARFGDAVILLIFAFVGIEVALIPSGEVKNPARTVPRSAYLALVVTTIIYLMIQL